MKRIRFLLITFFIATSAAAQDLETKLANLAQVDSTYLTQVDISVGKQPMSELLRSVARVAEVNLSIKGAENIQVSCNFSRARVTDLLLFLCKEYNLDIDVVGNIVAVHPVIVPPPVPKEIKVSYKDSLLSLDLSGDRLVDVTKKITDLSGVNFFVPHAISQQQLSGYLVDMHFGEAITAIAAMNNLEATKDADGVWAFYIDGDQSSTSPTPTPAYRRRMPFSPTELSVDSLGLITAQIGRGSLEDIIVDLCEQQRLDYFFAAPVSGQTSVWVRGVDFETLLDVMLLGTDISYYRKEGVWIFDVASPKNQIVTLAKVDMKYRSVNKLSEVIPDGLKSGVQVKEFVDLNSIILCGERAKVSRIEGFLHSIDKRVPMVTIEIMIVNAIRSRVVDMGTEFGFGKSGVTSGGSIGGGGGIDLTLNALSVNNVINSFNGFGGVNLGKVSSGFYFGLQFLEDNSVIDMVSTPKLSTLNGHEATLKSGETKYYKEIANNYYGSQIPVSTESYMWKSIDANMDVKITPFVSEDRHITLAVELNQTEFTAREEAEAPPGTATRSFSSLVRVQDGEMVLLGGIEQKSTEKGNRGLPWLSRIPILRLLFGKRKDRKNDRLLSVFIKPTIIE